jgi:hypothetical protein
VIIAHAMVMSPLSRGHLQCQQPSAERLDRRTGADFATVCEPWPEQDAWIAALDTVGPGWRS